MDSPLLITYWHGLQDEAPTHPQNLARNSFVKNKQGKFEPVIIVTFDCCTKAGVSNSKWLAGSMRHKVRPRGPHRKTFFDLCVNSRCIWKNKQIDLIFPLKNHYFPDVLGLYWYLKTFKMQADIWFVSKTRTSEWHW